MLRLFLTAALSATASVSAALSANAKWAELFSYWASGEVAKMNAMVADDTTGQNESGDIGTDDHLTDDTWSDKAGWQAWIEKIKIIEFSEFDIEPRTESADGSFGIHRQSFNMRTHDGTVLRRMHTFATSKWNDAGLLEQSTFNTYQIEYLNAGALYNKLLADWSRGADVSALFTDDAVNAWPCSDVMPMKVCGVFSEPHATQDWFKLVANPAESGIHWTAPVVAKIVATSADDTRVTVAVEVQYQYNGVGYSGDFHHELTMDLKQGKFTHSNFAWINKATPNTCKSQFKKGYAIWESGDMARVQGMFADAKITSFTQGSINFPAGGVGVFEGQAARDWVIDIAALPQWTYLGYEFAERAGDDDSTCSTRHAGQHIGEDGVAQRIVFDQTQTVDTTTGQFTEMHLQVVSQAPLKCTEWFEKTFYTWKGGDIAYTQAAFHGSTINFDSNVFHSTLVGAFSGNEATDKWILDIAVLPQWGALVPEFKSESADGNTCTYTMTGEHLGKDGRRYNSVYEQIHTIDTATGKTKSMDIGKMKSTAVRAEL